MIRRDKENDVTIVECDNCDKTIELISDQYAEVSRIIRGLHWKIDKIRDEYIHLCPKCATEEVFAI
jgi:hypothetical protein